MIKFNRKYSFTTILLHFTVISIVCTTLFVYQYGTVTPLMDTIVAMTSYFYSLDIETYHFIAEQPVSGIRLNSTPSEAFVTFCNNNPKYLSLLPIILDSIHYFSTRSIIVYGIDIDLNFNETKYPRLIQRRLSQKDCGPSIYFCKIYAILNSEIDYGIYIEADTLVNWNVDILFDLLHQWKYPLPIAPRHPDDPNNYHRFLRQFRLTPSDRTTPYIHAHILWTYRAYPFLQRAVHLLQRGYFMGANYDETALNILLWLAKSNHTLCQIDPFIDYFVDYEMQNSTCNRTCHCAFIFIHGSKNSIETENIFQRLKLHAGLPFIQTLNHGFQYSNQTQHTCCYPDSQSSSIHPLLCEH